MERIDDFLEKTILDIEGCDSQTIAKNIDEGTFELRSDPSLSLNLSGNIGALIIRAILRELNINEHHVLKWRLENKYRQYQVLNYYFPGCMAKTISFSKVLNEDNGVQKIRELCENGFFIKSTLGDGTGRAKSFDRTKELEDIIRSHQQGYEPHEKWMLQEKLTLNREFRVHTFSKDLIYGLTFELHGKYSSDNFDVHEFVKVILEKLPDTILQGTLIGWDIGVTDTNKYYVIEANITGFHPEFNPGFQTSGYFGDPDYGPVMCAWLNNYFRIKYHISIASVEGSLLSTDEFYKDFMFYAPIFTNEHLEILSNKTKDESFSAIIYLQEDISTYLIRLLEYFQIGNFCKRYYLIVNEEHFLTVSSRFERNNLIDVLAEHILFTQDQYLLITGLDDERRKKICFYHALRIIKEEVRFMV